MSDLIQRQDAINAIEAEIDDLGEHIKKAKLCIGKDAEWIERFADYRRDGLIDAVMSIESLPSAGQNCILCEYYTEIETDDGIKGKCTRRTGSDLISRQGVSAWLSNMGHEKLADIVMDERRVPFVVPEYKTFCGIPIEEAARIVQEYNAEPKTGKWIRNDNGTYSCCVCQSWIPEEQHGYARYCLYCGAKMIGEEE